MKNSFLAIMAATLAVGCADVPTSRHTQLPDRVCWLFGGQVYCPPKDGSQLVLPCKSTECLSERPIPVVRIEPPVVHVPPPTIIAPTDTSGRPMPYANVVGAGYNGVVPTPYTVQDWAPYVPPTTVWVQPPAKRVPTGVLVRPYWTMDGPPLHGHHR